MKILHLNEHLGWRGGIETYLLTLFPHLEEQGHPQVAVFAEGDSDLVGRSHRLPLLGNAGRRVRTEAREQMLRILDEEKPAVVHVHNIYNIGAIEACLETTPTMVTSHDYRYICPASTLYYRRTEEVCPRTCGLGCFSTTLRKRCLTPRPRRALNYYGRVRWFARNMDRFAHVIAPSEFARTRYIQSGFPAEKVTTLPYFCPIEPLPEPRQQPKEPTILFIGRIRPNKGIRYFVQALGLLPPTVRGVVVGDLTADRERELTQLAAEAGCADRLEMQPWADRETIAEVYRRASVFVFPSVWAETLGIVGLEAMACGVPVVASDIGGVRQWLRHEETGLLVPPKDPRAIVGAVRKILDSGDGGETMGQEGITLIREHFSPGMHVRGLLRLCQSMVLSSGNQKAVRDPEALSSMEGGHRP